MSLLSSYLLLGLIALGFFICSLRDALPQRKNIDKSIIFPDDILSDLTDHKISKQCPFRLL